MQYRQLGKSGLQVSAVGLGANNFGGRVEAERSASVIHAALDAGVNFIDTSNSYGGGLSEQFIGDALRGRRHEAVIATKVSSRVADGPNNAGNSRKHVMDQVDVSLRKLQTDYIDLYQIHWVGPTDAAGRDPCARWTIWSAPARFATSDARTSTLGKFAKPSGFPRRWASGDSQASSRATPCSTASRKRSCCRCATRYGIGVLPYYPLENGFLTGKYRRDAPAPEGTRLAADDRGVFTDRNFDILEALEAFCAERGHTILELAFAWLLAAPSVSSVIAGATRPEQIQANAASADWTLSDDELSTVNAILQN